jgi:hypothetical protein
MRTLARRLAMSAMLLGAFLGLVPFASAAEETGPVLRIVSPLADAAVAPGEGRVGAGRPNGAGFALNLEIITRDAVPIAVREATIGPNAPGIRHVDGLGKPNPDFPGLTVRLDTDLITPDGAIIAKGIDLGALFNVAGTDDTPGPGVTIWAGWHVLESLPTDVNTFTITASVRDATGRVGQDTLTVRVKRDGAPSGQALTPGAETGKATGQDDPNGPTVTMIAPRVPSAVSANPTLMFIQVTAEDRARAGIGVNETGSGIVTPAQPLGLIFDPAQIPNTAMGTKGGPNRNYPGLSLTFDADLKQPNGNVVPAGTNLAAIFDIAGSEVNRGGFVVTTADWVVGGTLQRGGVALAPGDRLAITARVTDNAGKTGTARNVVDISPVVSGQDLTPAPGAATPAPSPTPAPTPAPAPSPAPTPAPMPGLPNTGGGAMAAEQGRVQGIATGLAIVVGLGLATVARRRRVG